MNSLSQQQQEILLSDIEELEWNCQAAQCVKKCEEYISQFPNCRKVIPSYAHMYQFIDYKKATDIAKKMFDEDKFYFKNTYIYAYLLFDFEKRGRDDLNYIYNSYKVYKGEKDIYYYMAIAVAAKQIDLPSENKKYLREAVKEFQEKDKMIARVYHHLYASTLETKYLDLSVKLQPNFDYNHYFIANRQSDSNQEILFQNKVLKINPLNYCSIFKKSEAYYILGSREEYFKVFDEFLSLKQYFPSKIFCLINKIKILIIRDSDTSKRKQIPFDIIKKAFLFESDNSYIKFILQLYLKNQELFTTKDNFIPQIRELLWFYWSNNPISYLLLTNYKDISKDGDEKNLDIEQILFKESHLNMKTFFSILAYNKHVKDQISFQSKCSFWDLFID